MDRLNRDIVGWSVASSMEPPMVLAPLRRASGSFRTNANFGGAR